MRQWRAAMVAGTACGNGMRQWHTIMARAARAAQPENTRFNVRIMPFAGVRTTILLLRLRYERLCPDHPNIQI